LRRRVLTKVDYKNNELIGDILNNTVELVNNNQIYKIIVGSATGSVGISAS